MRPVLVVLFLTVGCAHGQRSPSTDGWRELRSAHFRLRTDLSLDDARTTLRRLEVLRAAVRASWSEDRDFPGITDAIVLHDRAELQTFSDLAGLATTTHRAPLLVTAGVQVVVGDGSPDVAVLAHEVAHDLNRRRMPVIPRWFDEGLAAYLENLEVLGDDLVRFGATNPDVLGKARTERLLPLAALEELSWESSPQDEVAAHFRSARLWIHALRAEEPRRMKALETSLAAGVPWRTAWHAEMAEVDSGRITESLHRWLSAGTLPTELRRFRPPTASTEDRPLAAWEANLTLAELWAVGATEGSPQAEARAGRRRAEIEAAARAAPEEPAPRVLLADLEPDRETRRARAEALAREHPGSPEAAVLLARVLRDDGGPVEGREEATRHAVSLAPDDVDALTAHALEQLRLARYGTALESARRAVQLAPWNPLVFSVLAAALARVDRCPEALRTQQRAIDVLPDRAAPADVAALVGERSRLEAACRAPRACAGTAPPAIVTPPACAEPIERGRR